MRISNNIKNSFGEWDNIPELKLSDEIINFFKSGGNLKIKCKKGSGIHIKKKNRGKFTASAKKAGQSVQEHARSVLNDPNATPLQKKRANFARNSKKWHHKNGGSMRIPGVIDSNPNLDNMKGDYVTPKKKKKKVKKHDWGGFIASVNNKTKSLANKGLKALGTAGEAITNAVSGLATSSYVQPTTVYNPYITSVGSNAKVKKNAEQKVKKAMQTVGTYSSPVNYVAALTQGTINPIVGEQKVSELDPRIQLALRTTELAGGAKTIKGARNIALDTTVGNFNLSKYINQDKLFTTNRIGSQLAPGGSEVAVYIDRNNPRSRVLKISKKGMSKEQADKYMQARVLRNKQPYYAKERVEGLIDNGDGTFIPVTSQKYIDLSKALPKNDMKAIKIQTELMEKKGFKRVPIQEHSNLPGANKIVNGEPIYQSWASFKSIAPDHRSITSHVFSNGKFYTMDNRLGLNSFVVPHLPPIKPYRLINIDTDVVPLTGKYKGFIPAADK